MEKATAQNLSKELKISINQVVQEYWEMMILKELAEGKLGDCLIFAGGTALRLAYNSPRFSNDLDFYLRKKLNYLDFKTEAQRISKKYKLAIVDLVNKHYTFLAEFKIKVDYLPLPFRLKIEIRKKFFRKNYEPRILTSPTVNFQVLCYVLDLLKIKELKEAALKERKEPRDLFDLWFIAQKLKIPFTKPKMKFNKKEFSRILSKFLPQNYKNIINHLVDE